MPVCPSATQLNECIVDYSTVVVKHDNYNYCSRQSGAVRVFIFSSSSSAPHRHRHPVPSSWSLPPPEQPWLSSSPLYPQTPRHCHSPRLVWEKEAKREEGKVWVGVGRVTEGIRRMLNKVTLYVLYTGVWAVPLSPSLNLLTIK